MHCTTAASLEMSDEPYLVLYVPASIKVIGDDIFGKEGGKIIFRDK